MPPQPHPLLTLALPGNLLYKELTLVNLEEPATWGVVETTGRQGSLSSVDDREQFFQDMVNSLKVPLELIFVSVAQDAAGRHYFLCLENVRRVLQTPDQRDHFKFVDESTVKYRREAEGAALLYARPAPSASRRAYEGPETAEPQIINGVVGRQKVDPLLDEKKLCPKTSIWQNYHVIPELSLGLTQKLILCDEATLTRSLPEERIFEYLVLIVNCHESKSRIRIPGFYQVGACSTGSHPDVVAQEVHRWHSLSDMDMNRRNDEIQEKIWQALQTGTVAVHCLAGIHRAACIVACHFLWRHYILGDESIPSDQDKIYARLKAQRPHVEPAYMNVLLNYKKYLMTKALQA